MTDHANETQTERITPLRVCCMQRHGGVQCPDGLVMCCICFDRFTVDQLAVDDGSRVNVCAECGAREARILAGVGVTEEGTGE